MAENTRIASHLTCRYIKIDHLCGLVIRVPYYRCRGPGFDSQSYEILWVAMGLEWVHSTS
jgi:hypothetical protein